MNNRQHKDFDFSVLEQRLTGPAINEDFFDDFSGNIVTRNSTDKVVGESVQTYSHELIAQFRIRQSTSLRLSIADTADKIDVIFNNCRAIEAASVIRCELWYTTNREAFEPVAFAYDEFPKDRNWLFNFAGKTKELGTVLPDLTVAFVVSYEPVADIPYKSFVVQWERLLDNLGNKLGFQFGDVQVGSHADTLILSLYTDDENQTPVVFVPFGRTSSEFARAYKMLYGKEEGGFGAGNVAAETLKAKFNVRKLVDRMRPFIENVPMSPLRITYKTSSWIADHTLLVKLNLEPLKFDVIDVKFVYTILRNYFFSMIPDVLRREYAIGVAVTSEAGWHGENLKAAEFGRPAGQIQRPTTIERENTARVANVPLMMNGQPYKTNRFVEIQYGKNDARCYILIPSRNGYLCK